MQTKQTYKDKLLEVETSNINWNYAERSSDLSLIAAILYLGEVYDIPSSRLVSFLSFLLSFLLWGAFAIYKDQSAKAPLTLYNLEVPFRKWAEKDNVHRMTILLKTLGKDKIDAIDGDSGKSALHFAVSNGCVNAVDYLMTHDANLNLQDYDGNTPIHIAVLKLVNSAHGGASLLLKLATIPSLKGFLGTDGPERSIRPGIDLTLENRDGKTFLQLLREAANNSSDTVKAKNIFEKIAPAANAPQVETKSPELH